jgi:N,N-dimethylformamidase
LEIVGYSDRLSVPPGEAIQFMVSCSHPQYQAELVRLIHGDTNPAGPGFKAQPVESALAGNYIGRVQPLEPGSHVLVPDRGELRLDGSLTLQAWIMPTTPGLPTQGLLSRWMSTAMAGYALVIETDGDLGLLLGDGERVARVRTGVPLPAGEWAFVAATYDADERVVRLVQRPLRSALLGLGSASVETPIELGRLADSGTALAIAGVHDMRDDGAIVVRGHFNGKIEAPRIFASALAPRGVEALAEDANPARVGGSSLVAAWDFSADISSARITDTSGNRLDGAISNLPMRAVTGRLWDGREHDWRRAPHQYGAIYFHDDDLENANWDVDLGFTVPADMRSGVYAVHISAGDAEDYLPFFVRPRPGTATAPIAFLAPTNSYLAYANEHYSWSDPAFAGFGVGDPRERLQPQDVYQETHRLLSIYDSHSDGTGVCFSSWLRPIVSLRPKFFMQLIRAPHQFNADLHLINWLETKSFAYDVITDHDLHAEGLPLLRRYRTLVTGSHPEYWTEDALDALESYLGGGGRVMYLGGNGFWWVTSYPPAAPHAIEVRRGQNGTRTWESAPGEVHHQGTGEFGGQWKLRGRPPQKLVGVGYTGQGSDAAVPFRRLPESYDERATFIFEGVTDDPFGDFGLVLDGAGGAEIDRFDHQLGTPPQALRLATTTGFSDAYQAALDDSLFHDGKSGGTVNPLVRADMTYFETPAGGAVFSTGSISWCGSLSHNDSDNAVSRITENVLRRFSHPSD